MGYGRTTGAYMQGGDGGGWGVEGRGGTYSKSTTPSGVLLHAHTHTHEGLLSNGPQLL